MLFLLGVLSTRDFDRQIFAGKAGFLSNMERESQRHYATLKLASNIGHKIS
jgi:hypothetical protein